MTKARARKRAKAKAAAKRSRPGGEETTPQDKIRPGEFVAESNSMRNKVGADIKNLAGMKRGSARSR